MPSVVETTMVNNKSIKQTYRFFLSQLYFFRNIGFNVSPLKWGISKSPFGGLNDVLFHLIIALNQHGISS